MRWRRTIAEAQRKRCQRGKPNGHENDEGHELLSLVRALCGDSLELPVKHDMILPFSPTCNCPLSRTFALYM